MKINRYDVQVLAGILFLSLSVLLLMALLSFSVGFSISDYYTLPLGWFIGATMVWAWLKYNSLP